MTRHQILKMLVTFLTTRGVASLTVTRVQEQPYRLRGGLLKRTGPAKEMLLPVLYSSPIGKTSSPSSIPSYKNAPKWSPMPVVGLATWFTSLSYIIIRNYKIGPWLPVTLNKRVWVLIHAMSNMFFASGIVLSTILEWRVLATRNPEVIHVWFTYVVPRIETTIVLPSLTLAIVSGFAQTALDYGSMAIAPKHIRMSIHILATFAIWWMATDVTTVQSSKIALNDWYNDVTKEGKIGGQGTREEYSITASLPKVLYLRRWSNVVSCLFVASLYGIMTLKPGYIP
jgi:hypothetical protein